MPKNPPKEIGLLRKFVSTARSITTGQVALPLGIIRLNKNLTWLGYHNIQPLNKEELHIVNTYYNRIKEFPIEQERAYWSPDVLQKLDAKLERITAKCQPELMIILLRVTAEAT